MIDHQLLSILNSSGRSDFTSLHSLLALHGPTSYPHLCTNLSSFLWLLSCSVSFSLSLPRFFLINIYFSEGYLLFYQPTLSISIASLSLSFQTLKHVMATSSYSSENLSSQTLLVEHWDCKGVYYSHFILERKKQKSVETSYQNSPSNQPQGQN